jgi:hypothetical protein
MIGTLRKMKTSRDSEGKVAYELFLGDQEVPLNSQIGKEISIRYTGSIYCLSCNRKITKSFNQGYCYPCFTSLPETDMCIVKPEKCHFAAGTCRDSSWGLKHCHIPHVVYLANSSGLKVGVTRAYQKFHRWMDQGASQAIIICQTANRLDAGLVEIALAKHLQDKTNWRKMLKERPEDLDLKTAKENIKQFLPGAVSFLPGEDEVFHFDYPVFKYPSKIESLDFEKSTEVRGILTGIKGQYLMFDSAVINIRKFGGYEVDFSTFS